MVKRITFLLFVVAGLIPMQGIAAQDCSPQSIVGRAVGGQILNEMLGGLNAILGAAAGVENGISPTPSSVMQDCILPALNPPSPDSGDDSDSITSWPTRPPASGWGDPHLTTHDGLGFDFQGAGDYVYVQGGGVIVQARQVRSRADSPVSSMAAIAVRFNDTTVVLNDPIDASIINSEPGLLDLVTVNGEDMPIGLGGWIDLDTQGSYIQRFDKHTYLRVVGKLRLLVNHNVNQFRLVLDAPLRGQVSGVLGDFDGDPNNDLKTAAGVQFALGDSATLNGDYLQGWLRQGEESLFNSPYAATVDGSAVPDSVVSVSNATLSVREAAAQRCLDAGVSQGFALHGCIYDIVFAESDQWLADAVDVAEYASHIVPATALADSENNVIALGLDSSVSPQIPTEAAGVISETNEIDRYAITIPVGTSRLLQPVDPCSTAQPFSVLLEQDNEAAVEHALSCQSSSIALPEGPLILSVFSHGGDTGNYAFKIVEPANTELGSIELGSLVEGELVLGERLTATLPSVTGDRVFIVSNSNTDCAQSWELLDAAGTLVERTSHCIDMGLITLGDNTPYRIQIQQSTATRFGFTVLSVGGDITIIAPPVNEQFDLTISAPGQQASATFVLSEGDRIYINRDAGVTSGRLVVSNPQMAEVTSTSASQRDLQFIANSSGEYTLTLEPLGSFVGDVPITLIHVADDTAIDVIRGQSFSMALSTLGQRATASFDAVEGDTFTVTKTSSVVVSGIETLPAIQPPGVAHSLVIFGSRTFTADQTGTYQIVLDSTELDNFIGSMEFELH